MDKITMYMVEIRKEIVNKEAAAGMS